MSSHDCGLRAFDLAIRPDVSEAQVMDALKDFGEETGGKLNWEDVTFKDGTLEFSIDFYGYGGGEGDDNVRALVQTLEEMICDRGALILRDYDTGDYEASRTILGIGRSARERRLGQLDFQLEELQSSLSDLLSPTTFEATFAQPLRAAVSATFNEGEDRGREGGIESAQDA